MSEDPKSAMESLLDKLSNNKVSIDPTHAVPGLGMIVQGLAIAIIETTKPPDALVALKEKMGDDFSQAKVEAEAPEIAEEVSKMSQRMTELLAHCKRLASMTPLEVIEEGIKMSKFAHGEMEAKNKEDMPASDKEDIGEEGVENVDAPLNDGWHHNIKGNA